MNMIFSFDLASLDKAVDMLKAFQDASEDDVAVALAETSFQGWPQDDGELLEFFQCMIAVVQRTVIVADN